MHLSRKFDLFFTLFFDENFKHKTAVFIFPNLIYNIVQMGQVDSVSTEKTCLGHMSGFIQTSLNLPDFCLKKHKFSLIFFLETYIFLLTFSGKTTFFPLPEGLNNDASKHIARHFFFILTICRKL